MVENTSATEHIFNQKFKEKQINHYSTGVLVKSERKNIWGTIFYCPYAKPKKAAKNIEKPYPSLGFPIFVVFCVIFCRFSIGFPTFFQMITWHSRPVVKFPLPSPTLPDHPREKSRKNLHQTWWNRKGCPSKKDEFFLRGELFCSSPVSQGTYFVLSNP